MSRHLLEKLEIDEDALLLHGGQHLHERHLHPFVEIFQAHLADLFREDGTEPEGRLGALARVFFHALGIHVGRRQGFCAAAQDLFCRDQLAVQEFPGRLGDVVALPRGVEKVGAHHRVAARPPKADPQPGKHNENVLQVVAVFEDLLAAENRGELLEGVVAPGSPAFRAFSGLEGDVRGLSGLKRQGHPRKLGVHGKLRGKLQVQGALARLLDAPDQAV